MNPRLKGVTYGRSDPVVSQSRSAEPIIFFSPIGGKIYFRDGLDTSESESTKEVPVPALSCSQKLQSITRTTMPVRTNAHSSFHHHQTLHDSSLTMSTDPTGPIKKPPTSNAPSNTTTKNDDAALPLPLQSDQLQRLVQDHGYTPSLAESLNPTKETFALRYWIVDNSGSMKQPDGHRIIQQKKGTSNGQPVVTLENCTRWQEICDCVQHHIQLASLVQAPTRFRLLNNQVHPLTLSIGEDSSESTRSAEVKQGLQWIRAAHPDGLTPLTKHIRQLHQEISAMEPLLRQRGQRVSITIATDGLPTSALQANARTEFVESLRMLEGLPVWVVIRLCTDEDVVVDFYNNLDEILELSLDVLGDFVGEAKEVHQVNPWLNYTLALHRMREMGYHDRLFDLIDERRLTSNEIRDFCLLLFGPHALDGAPDPSADWKGFRQVLERAVEATPQQWNPIQKKLMPLINMKKLNRMYGGRSMVFWNR